MIDGISVYETRLRMGESLADKIRRNYSASRHRRRDPDPRFEPSRARCSCAKYLDLPYREGFIKNRYIGRTFIMPGQGIRKKSVRQKLNAIGMEFKGKNVLLVDDSIVRGTTSQRNRADGARGRRAQGVLRLGRAAGALSPTSTASTCRRATS